MFLFFLFRKRETPLFSRGNTSITLHEPTINQ
jgi:hypothetical protein